MKWFQINKLHYTISSMWIVVVAKYHVTKCSGVLMYRHIHASRNDL